MSISPRPWKEGELCIGHFIAFTDANGNRVYQTKENMEHELKCVNMHDELVATLRQMYSLAYGMVTDDLGKCQCCDVATVSSTVTLCDKCLSKKVKELLKRAKEEK